MSDPAGIPYVIPRYTYLGRVSLADHVLPSLNDAAWAISEIPCAIGPYGVTSHEWMSLNPLWEEVTTAVCLFQVEGNAFPVLSKSYCLGCSRNSSSRPSLCRTRSYRLPYRKDQEAYTGHWRGQLLWRFGRDPISSVTDVTRSSRLKGNVSVTYVTLVPWRREWIRHGPSPQSLYHSWAAGSPAQLLSENINECGAPAASDTCAAGCGSQMQNTASQCPLARLVTLKVDWSLWQDPISWSPTWRLRSLLQGTRVTYVTETLLFYYNKTMVKVNSLF